MYPASNDWHVWDDEGRRKYLNAAERAAFLRQANRLDAHTRGLCRTLIFTGCRISEALALSVHQLDLDRSTITFRTLKRRRLAFRVIPVPEGLIRDLLALVAEDGRIWAMHRTTAWRRVKAVMQAAGIKGIMATPKGARHAFGIRGAERGIPGPLLQRWMGHASPTTTAIYIDAVGAEERRFARRMW